MRYLFIASVFAAVGCGASAPADVPAGCNPIIGDDCATPFPSSFYEVADSATPTGVHVSVAPRGASDAAPHWSAQTSSGSLPPPA